MAAQRFRVRFRKGERVRYISHLDVLRSWERSLRRAGLPLAYSQGFTPHPKIAFAAPLPLGFIGEAEIMDVTLDDRVEQSDFEARLGSQTSDDLALISTAEIPTTAPQPQAALLWADYRVSLQGVTLGDARAAVAQFLARDHFEWTEQRNDKTRTYDLRAGVGQLAARECDGTVELTMQLQATQQMTARPEQVLAAILPDASPGIYHRAGLVLDETSPAREAWRRVGQFQ